MKIMSEKNAKKDSGKLTIRAPRALSSRVRSWVMEIKGRHRYGPRGLDFEDLIAAVTLDFMLKSPAEREAILRLRGPQVRQMLDREFEAEKAGVEPTQEEIWSVVDSGGAVAAEAAPDVVLRAVKPLGQPAAGKDADRARLPRKKSRGR